MFFFKSRRSSESSESLIKTRHNQYHVTENPSSISAERVQSMSGGERRRLCLEKSRGCVNSCDKVCWPFFFFSFSSFSFQFVSRDHCTILIDIDISYNTHARTIGLYRVKNGDNNWNINIFSFDFYMSSHTVCQREEQYYPDLLKKSFMDPLSLYWTRVAQSYTL